MSDKYEESYSIEHLNIEGRDSSNGYYWGCCELCDVKPHRACEQLSTINVRKRR